MGDLWLYHFLSKFRVLGYRGKIMAVAFLGTHIPLIALVAWAAMRASADWRSFTATLLVALVATLAGTGITLFVLNHLLRPVMLTGKTLRRYRECRDTGNLPVAYGDEVGTLMADASTTLTHLETVRDRLENVDNGTGLPNGNRLAAEAATMIRQVEPFCLAIIRVENFARLSGTLSHEAAETVAATLAERFEAALEKDDTLFRVSSDDFVILRPVALSDRGQTIAGRLRAILDICTDRIPVEGVAVEPVLRAGVAFSPADGATPDLLVDHARGALVQATPDMPVGLHSPAARKEARRRLELEQELRRAIARDEFVLHYQPVIDLERGRVAGAEALIRWQHPDRGLVFPGGFIGAAEETGLIDEIGLWTLRQSCAQVREWNGMGLDRLKVAVNLSARQFLDRELVARIDETLRDTGVAAEQIEVELTETAAMADEDHTRAIFGKLRDRGVSIAIDDFGTGYASMSYLRRLPFDKLKIDREFVSEVQNNAQSQAICDALIALARGLDLRLLAEGTETEAEVDYLRSRGCNMFQGYYFSRPVAPVEFVSNAAALALTATAMKLRDGMVRSGMEASARPQPAAHRAPDALRA